MAVATDCAQPVQVNGFTCRNCTDVDNARKHIDPQHPKSGPFDVDAATDPTRQSDPKAEAARATPRATGTLLDTSARARRPRGGSPGPSGRPPARLDPGACVALADGRRR